MIWVHWCKFQTFKYRSNSWVCNLNSKLFFRSKKRLWNIHQLQGGYIGYITLSLRLMTLMFPLYLWNHLWEHVVPWGNTLITTVVLLSICQASYFNELINGILNFPCAIFCIIRHVIDYAYCLRLSFGGCLPRMRQMKK